MAANPALGVIIFTLGGLAGAVFYLPFKKVKNWAWESYWLVYAVVGLVIVPWVLALSTSPNVLAVLAHSPLPVLGYCFLCGAMWGLGGLTWGLMIRYLGVGLGLAIGCGLTSAAGTLIPPILGGRLHDLYGNPAADIALVGVGVSILGIILVGMAGMSKEKELPEAEKKKAVAEYNFKKGILVAVFSGLMSSGMSFGLQGGPELQIKAQYGSESLTYENVNELDAHHRKDVIDADHVKRDPDTKLWVEPAVPAAERLTTKTWRGMPVLVVVLAGGFVINFLWCLFLNAKNKTFPDYVRSGTPLVPNVIFAGLAGAIWCSQFICFKTGEPAMGDRAYIGWAVLMASAILFSTLLGILLGEWKGTSGRTRVLLALGLLLLLGSSVAAGYSGYAKNTPAAKAVTRCLVPPTAKLASRSLFVPAATPRSVSPGGHAGWTLLRAGVAAGANRQILGAG
jgi:L-rhamnose-H+ transport protein